MEPEVLDVDDGEVEGLEDRHHLPQARGVAAGEDPLLQPCVDRGGTVAADAVDEREAVRLERAGDDLAEGRVVPDADVLQHAHRDERVAGALDVAVVVLHELHRPAHALARRALARVCDLLLRDVEGADPDAVLARHVQGEGAPSTTGFDDLLTRLEHQLAADVVELRALRLLQGRLRRVVVRTGVDHLLVEPQAVEVVAQIVVVVDVAARAGGGVGTRLRQPAQQAALGGGRTRAIHASITSREHVDEVALDLDAPCAERIPESKLGIQDRRKQCAAITKDDAPVAFARQAAGVFTVPQGERDVGPAHLGGDSPHEPAIESVRARSFFPGRSVRRHSRAEGTRQTQRMLALSSCLHLLPPVSKQPMNHRAGFSPHAPRMWAHSARCRARAGIPRGRTRSFGMKREDYSESFSGREDVGAGLKRELARRGRSCREAVTARPAAPARRVDVRSTRHDRTLRQPPEPVRRRVVTTGVGALAGTAAVKRPCRFTFRGGAGSGAGPSRRRRSISR